MTLRTQAFSGVRWTTFSSLGRAVLQIVQIAVLARLLAPSDFGQIAVVLAITSFLQIFADAGIGNAIIHYQEITQQQRSSLYWLSVIIGIVLALMLSVSGPWIASWYREPILQNLLILAGLSMATNSLGQQLRITAQKELRFAQLAKVELMAVLTGFLTSIILAMCGAGVYSLAFGSLILSAASSAYSWLFLAQGWWPNCRFRVDEIRPFLKFGTYMVGNNLMNSFSTQVDVLMGTRLFGVDAMGAYSVSKNLNLNVQTVINPIITQVGLPIMARAQQDEALLKRIYLQTMRMTASVNFPIYMGIAFFAPEIVRFMLGEKWTAAISLLQIFACWGLLRSIGNPVGSLLFAKGRVDLAFKWNFVLLLCIGPTIWIGSHFGVESMAMTAAGLMAALIVPGWHFLIRPLCGATLREYLSQLLVPLLISVIAVTTAFFIANIFEYGYARLLTGFLVGAAIYCWGSACFNRTWFSAMTELLTKKK